MAAGVRRFGSRIELRRFAPSATAARALARNLLRALPRARPSRRRRDGRRLQGARSRARSVDRAQADAASDEDAGAPRAPLARGAIAGAPLAPQRHRGTRRRHLRRGRVHRDGVRCGADAARVAGRTAALAARDTRGVPGRRRRIGGCAPGWVDPPRLQARQRHGRHRRPRARRRLRAGARGRRCAHAAGHHRAGAVGRALVCSRSR